MHLRLCEKRKRKDCGILRITEEVPERSLLASFIPLAERGAFSEAKLRSSGYAKPYQTPGQQAEIKARNRSDAWDLAQMKWMRRATYNRHDSCEAVLDYGCAALAQNIVWN